ncbi:RNA polymerase I subunit [Pseudomonas phage Zuri]|uniref:Uncharacterized protein n=1 Tax=Pseudomonas phage Zuri TaxID=2604899 RepID=A0A5C1K578_9CAUD|nr:RNA polymerase I subunit [Pseudomonas phage Zuri]QEM41100.1 hypothetical protein Zuri_3 [Pseudomonas phage Zuri]
MGKINFNQTFGNNAAQAQTPAAQRPKAEYWLNVGYDSGVKDEETGESRFVSLAAGIPLDSIEKLKTNSSNRTFAQFQAARNDLHDQIMAIAQSLEPGQSVIIDTETTLQIQIRRVREEVEDLDNADNQFARQLVLAR